MLVRLFLILALSLLAGPASAAPLLKLDTLKVGSKVYRNVTVLGASPTDIYFTHAEGISNVKLKYVDPDLQKRFKYDAKAANETEKLQSQRDTLYHALVVSNLVAQASRTARVARLAAATSERSLADAISDKSPLGKPGPELQVGKWLTDQPKLENKFVLTFFWAPWSIPCRKAIPELNALQKKFPDKLVLVALTSESETDIDTMPGDKIAFASALDLQARTSNALELSSLPTVLLRDPKGTVLYLGHPAALTDKTLEKFILAPPE